MTTRYMIELYNVSHEIAMYLEDLKDYGEITHYTERYPTMVWLESMWDKDVLKTIYGVKIVREPKYTRRSSSVL
jgi:hypothetical protein